MAATAVSQTLIKEISKSNVTASDEVKTKKSYLIVNNINEFNSN